jgi:hypothetical protein
VTAAIVSKSGGAAPCFGCGHGKNLHCGAAGECMHGLGASHTACACNRFVPPQTASPLPNQEPSMSTVADPPPGNVSTWTTIEAALEDLVLDPALQCRASVDEDTVAAYAQLLQDGGRFKDNPRAVRVDGVLFVVDGWHRHGAYKRATVKRVHVDVRDGTRRDAILAAVKANSDHGRQRTNKDRRRAVAVLLMDREWCRLSNREISKLADVSHTYVAELRKDYGVAVGEVLTPERAEHVDGEPAGEWRLLLQRTPTYARADVEALRKANSPEAIAKAYATSHYGSMEMREALKLRAEELAVNEWPWPEDLNSDNPDAVSTWQRDRVSKLDSLEDITAAALATACPDRVDLYLLIVDIVGLAKRTYGLDELIRRWKNRPALRKAAEQRKAQHEAAEEKRHANDPWFLGKAIERLSDNPDAQAAAVEAAKDHVIGHIDAAKLHPSVRDGVFRDRVAKDGVWDCPNPLCGGWLRPKSWAPKELGICTRCGKDGGEWNGQTRNSFIRAGELLRTQRYGLKVSGVVVDKPAIDLLGALEAAGDLDGWIRKAPSDVRLALQGFVKRTRPEVLFDADVVDDEADDESDDDEGDDADGGEE